MDQILALRPFVPARDLAQSRRFYEALGFIATRVDPPVVLLKRESFSFILIHAPAHPGGGPMVQLLLRDVERFWVGIDFVRLTEDFPIRPPEPPAIQLWGLKVGFVHDPSGVTWHMAEAPF